MKRTMIHLTCCAAALFFVGCEHETVMDLSGPEGERPLRFSAVLASGGGSVDIETRAQDKVEAVDDTIKAKLTAARNAIEKTKFNYGETGGDLIRICNVESNNATPYFSLSLGDRSARTYEYECKKYIGRYKDEGTAEEDTVLGQDYLKYSEYSFEPHNSKGFFRGDLVSYDNKHMFYAMWRGSYRDDQSVEAYIPADQSTLSGLQTADIMLAYLSKNISSEDSIRLFFRHSLCMIDVHLTLPLYTPGGDTDKGGQVPPSGYRLAEVEMEMTNIPTDFTISSSEALSSAAMVTVVPGSNTVDRIPMYKYFVEDSTQTWENPDAGHKEKDNEDEEEESQYRTYGFCGIVPPMKWAASNTTPLLRVKLKDAATGKDESYVYIPTESSESANAFNLVQGNISILEFKISRSMKEMMLVRAEVQPWTQATGNLSFTEGDGKIQP